MFTNSLRVRFYCFAADLVSLTYFNLISHWRKTLYSITCFYCISWRALQLSKTFSLICRYSLSFTLNLITVVSSAVDAKSLACVIFAGSFRHQASSQIHILIDIQRGVMDLGVSEIQSFV